MNPLKPRPAKVFLSYSHDSPAHREWVLRLATRLATDGLEVHLDQLVLGTPAEGWPRWMLDALDWADYVLVVCTETYYRRFRGHEEPGRGRGVDWEGALISGEMYEVKSRTRKFVPVLFEAAAERFIPEPLRGHSFYVLEAEESYRALYRFLTGQPEFQPVPQGELIPLPVRKVEPLRWDGPCAVNAGGSVSVQTTVAAVPWWRRPAGWGLIAGAVVLGIILVLALRQPRGAEQSLGMVLNELLAALREGTPVAAGFWAEAGPTPDGPWRRLHDGDWFRMNEYLQLRFHVRERAFLYLLNKDSEGKAEVLMPKTPGEDHSNGPAGPRSPGAYTFPKMVGLTPYYFTNAPAKESFVLFASSREVPQLPRMLSEFAQAGREQAAKQADARARRWREGNLRFSTLVRTVAGNAGDTNAPGESGTPSETPIPLFAGRETATVLTLNLRVER